MAEEDSLLYPKGNISVCGSVLLSLEADMNLQPLQQQKLLSSDPQPPLGEQ